MYGRWCRPLRASQLVVEAARANLRESFEDFKERLPELLEGYNERHQLNLTVTSFDVSFKPDFTLICHEVMLPVPSCQADSTTRAWSVAPCWSLVLGTQVLATHQTLRWPQI